MVLLFDSDGRSLMWSDLRHDLDQPLGGGECVSAAFARPRPISIAGPRATGDHNDNATEGIRRCIFSFIYRCRNLRAAKYYPTALRDQLAASEPQANPVAIVMSSIMSVERKERGQR